VTRTLRRAGLAGGLAALVAAAPAEAATFTFSYTGSEQVFTVPAGVTSVEVTVVGARGGAAMFGAAGGRGALVTGTLTVNPGQPLYVEVGGPGSVRAGGFNGGGTGGDGIDDISKGAGGGGATDVRGLPRSNLVSLTSRRIIAAGGGGASIGGGGGNAEATGGGVSGSGGGAGTQTAGGAAGMGGNAQPGTAGRGGDGGSSFGNGGGGGGGGRYGGGGGAGNEAVEGTGGGGGGSSLVPSVGTKTLAPATFPSGAQLSFTPSAGGGGGAGGGAGGGGAGGAPDRIPPVLSRFLIIPFSFSTANFGPSVARVGTRLLYRVSEAATTTFTVQRARPGVRRGRRCLPRRRGMRGRSCTRYVAVRGSFRHRSEPGLNTLRFSGRVAGRRLALGRYRLTAVARDAAGNRSQPVRKRFRIVRR
jgi:hypothetical protein